jgi:Xaa-Pro aminopeptidase
MQVLEQEGSDALLVAGHPNFAYVTGVVLPFAPHFPDRKAIAVLTRAGEGCILCPLDWEQSVRDQGWKGKIVKCREEWGAGSSSFVDCLGSIARKQNLQKGRIGLDSSALPARFVENVKESLPSVDWVPCDAFLGELRLTKTPAEVNLIETASRHSEIGIIGALQHMEGSLEGTGYTLSEFTERVRVHVYEAGGSGVGLMATMRGAEGKAWFSLPHGKFQEGDFVRIEVTNHVHGYWSNACRTVVIGRPTEGQLNAYKGNLRLKKAAEGFCRPGVSCREIVEEVARTAQREGIDYCPQFGLGHGVGTSEREAPYLHTEDRTILKPGMVVMLSIYSHGMQGELICSKDTYEITSKGARLLSWYKNWDRLYCVTGFRSAH